MDEAKVKLYLSRLENVIKDRYNPSEYCFLGAQDSSVCIIRNADKWEVFFIERGHKEDAHTFDTLMEACLVFLDKLGEDNNDSIIMKNEFLNAFESTKTA